MSDNRANMIRTSDQLIYAVYGILSGSQLSPSKFHIATVPNISTTKQTTGLMGENSNVLLGRGDDATSNGNMTGLWMKVALTKPPSK